MFVSKKSKKWRSSHLKTLKKLWTSEITSTAAKKKKKHLHQPLNGSSKSSERLKPGYVVTARPEVGNEQRGSWESASKWIGERYLPAKQSTIQAFVCPPGCLLGCPPLLHLIASQPTIRQPNNSPIQQSTQSECSEQRKHLGKARKWEKGKAFGLLVPWVFFKKTIFLVFHWH